MMTLMARAQSNNMGLRSQLSSMESTVKLLSINRQSSGATTNTVPQSSSVAVEPVMGTHHTKPRQLDVSVMMRRISTCHAS